MPRNIDAEVIIETPIEKQHIEIVERKGIGHPDSLADGIAEEVSRSLSKMYMDEFDRILHHNTDEVQIIGGQAEPEFGGGLILDPISIILVGRAVTSVGEKRLPYRSVALHAADNYLNETCTNLKTRDEVTFHCQLGRGSMDLMEVYDTRKGLANDTSFGVSFAPFSGTEKSTLEVEKFINGPLKRDLPEVGQDVKVMATRIGDELDLTIAAAIVDKYTPDADHYISVVDELKNRVNDEVLKHTERDVKVDVNTADDYDRGIYYLTVTGLSMENGDDGSVGRGNRVNGIITPFRPMSMEAAAGKNPVTHVGKLYNLAAKEIAEKVYEELQDGVHDVFVRLVSQIGKPIDEPQVASIQLVVPEKGEHSKYLDTAETIADEYLENISDLTTKVLKGEITVF
ncbi:MAG: methionine adenosyltransferase [Thermoplasmata archaeon]